MTQIAAHVWPQYEAHLLAASGLIPVLSPGSSFIGIGGGMADVTYTGMSAASIAQAGLRAAYRHLAKESRARRVAVRQLVLHSMIAGESNADNADPSWITAEQVGRAVCEMVQDDGDSPEAVLDLRPSS